MKLAKHIYPSTQAAYKTDPKIPDNQTFIYQSAPFVKNIETKYFSGT